MVVRNVNQCKEVLEGVLVIDEVLQDLLLELGGLKEVLPVPLINLQVLLRRGLPRPLFEAQLLELLVGEVLSCKYLLNLCVLLGLLLLWLPLVLLGDRLDLELDPPSALPGPASS